VANINASKKDIRKSRRRKILNSQQKSRLRTFDKKVRSLVEDGNISEAEQVFKTYASFLDRAGKTNLIHHCTADRKKSRIAMLLNKAKASKQS